MKKLVFSTAMFVVMAACGGGGGGDKQALLDSCIAEGETEETCGCLVDAMADNLSPGLLKKMATAANDGESDPSAMMGDLSAEEQAEFMTLLPSMLQCSMPNGLEIPTE